MNLTPGNVALALLWTVVAGLGVWLLLMPVRRRSLTGLLVSTVLTGAAASQGALWGGMHAMLVPEWSWRSMAVLTVLSVGVTGVAVLVGPAALGAGGDLLGSLACLGGALCYGIGARFFAPISRLPTMLMVTAQLWAGALLLLPAVLLIDRPWSLPAPSAQAWAALLALGLFSSAFAYLLFFRLAASAGIANAMLVTFLVPVTALLLGRLVLGEPITPGAVLGAAVIAAGLALLDGRWLPARRGTPA